MFLKQRRATPHRLISKTTKAILLVLCLAVLTSGCSSISRLQEFPEPPQAFGGTRQNIRDPGEVLERSFEFASGVVGPISGSAENYGALAAGVLVMLPFVLPAIIVEIPLTLAADIVVLPVTIPAELWWYSQNEGPPDEPEAPGLEEGELDPEGLPSLEEQDGLNLDDLEDPSGDD